MVVSLFPCVFIHVESDLLAKGKHKTDYFPRLGNMDHRKLN